MKSRRRVIIRNHKFLPDGKYLYYRVVMAEHLGRPLLSSEHIHHKDGDFTNDRLDNLELLSAGAHARVTNTGKKRSRETRKRISEAQKGIAKNHGAAISKSLKGKKWSKKRKAKHSKDMENYFKNNPRPKNEPWLELGISRRTWYRRRKENL